MKILISFLTQWLAFCLIVAVLISFQLHTIIGDGFTIFLAAGIWASLARYISKL